MTKNKHGNNKFGTGFADFMYLAEHHPIKYWIACWAANIGLIRLAKRMLDIK